MTKAESSFEQLTWDDIASWAGSRILSRGKTYKVQVSDLCHTNDGGILAWVRGTENYATLVRRGSPGNLSSICTCPYAGNPCKHSVATVLAFLDKVKNKQDVPHVPKADRRLALIEGGSSEEITDPLWGEDEGGEAEQDYYESEQVTGEKHSTPKGRFRPSRTRKASRGEIVRQRIESMGSEQLVEFVINLVKEYPEIGRKIEEEEDLKAGRVTKIVRTISAEIEKLASEPSWRNSWSGEGNTPDYSRVRERLQSLLDSGHADEVVGLGKELWHLGNEQVGSSDDEGEVGCQISECMTVILQAVTKSSLSIRDQILWTIDTCLSDKYGLLDGSKNYLAKFNDKKSWTEVADSLLSRLETAAEIHKITDFSSRYGRQQVMNWAIEALARCGRRKDIIPLLEREAPITQCYGTLVERLLSANRRAEAKVAAVEGFRHTIDSASGIAWDLEVKLRRMAEQDKDLPMVAAYSGLEFFHRPSLNSYKAFRKAAEVARQWPAVREAAIRFLETGSRPDLQEPETLCNAKSKGNEPWPLPYTQISIFSRETMRHQFPDTITLIRIAIDEKDTDEVIRRYNLVKNSRFFDGSIDNDVAEAVQGSHPDVSLKIWKNLAEAQIKMVKPAAYEVAAGYLRKMRDLYQKTHRIADWTALVNSIRAAHKPKRSLMQILDTLEAKRIVDS